MQKLPKELAFYLCNVSYVYTKPRFCFSFPQNGGKTVEVMGAAVGSWKPTCVHLGSPSSTYDSEEFILPLLICPLF